MTNVKQVVALTVFLLSAVAYSADFNVRDFGALLSRRVCEEGFVLLKNENAALPLSKGAKVAAFAPAYGQWLAGSGVSALVKSPYVVDLPEGLANAGFDVDPDSRETAVFVISRECGRGKEPDLGAYELKDEETAELARIKSLGFKRIVVVLNCGVFVATRDLAADPAVSAILYVGLPAMEGGNAIANVLSGAVNPSGRLTQTLARRIEDYPADENWQEALLYVPFEDDIFVGYRYFETLPGAAEKVVYPFGHGLSYTTWKVEPEECARLDDGVCRVRVRVSNTGKAAGRHSVLCYTSLAGGKAEHPAIELRAFAKTRLLQPGESESLELSFDTKFLAYFDDEGVSGHPGSWVIDGGDYTVWAGGGCRDVVKAGVLHMDRRILSSPGLKLSPAHLARRMRAGGMQKLAPVVYGDKNGPLRPVEYPSASPDRKIMFSEVLAGTATLDGFIDQLPAAELAELFCGKPNIAPDGNTGSIGRLDEYGVPGVQTADGPLGLRLKTRTTTSFPSTDLLAGSFDVDLAEEVGRAMALEARQYGVDVYLAPGININRHPLCARNMEFMGEDPALAGEMGAAVVRGIQSTGLSATAKHYVMHNRLNVHRSHLCIISERAAREIYIRAFEILLAKSSPDCIMTSYNGMNGRAAGADTGAIDGILRGELGYNGVVMTDWYAVSAIWSEISAGNDVKMPNDGGTLKDSVKQIRDGWVDPRKVRASAKRILSLVLRHAAGCNMGIGHEPCHKGKMVK